VAPRSAAGQSWPRPGVRSDALARARDSRNSLDGSQPTIQIHPRDSPSPRPGTEKKKKKSRPLQARRILLCGSRAWLGSIGWHPMLAHTDLSRLQLLSFVMGGVLQAISTNGHTYFSKTEEAKVAWLLGHSGVAP